MQIKKTCKKIIEVLLADAIQGGSLKRILINLDSIMQKVDVSDKNFFMICLAYMQEKQLLEVRKSADTPLYANILFAAIDFVECDNAQNITEEL